MSDSNWVINRYCGFTAGTTLKLRELSGNYSINSLFVPCIYTQLPHHAGSSGATDTCDGRMRCQYKQKVDVAHSDWLNS